MAAIDDGAPPRDVLSMAWQCERWNTLPDNGGYYEQDYMLMHQMTAASNVYLALKAFRDRYSEGDAIHKMPDSVRRVIGYLKREGLL